jgi:hypothetical protein
VPYDPYVIVKNTGNQEITTYETFLRIRMVQGPILVTDTIVAGPLSPGYVDTIVFPAWTPMTPGPYQLEAWVYANGDLVPFNDSAIVEMRVVNGHTALHYINDSTTVGLTHWFGAGGGFGAKFTPPYYPCPIETVSVMLAVAQGSTPGNAGLYIFDDDGPGGMPGTILAADTVYVSSNDPMWFNLVPSTPITINDGSFYIGYIQMAEEGPDFAVDQSPPFSRQFLEYTGAWAFYRDREFADPMIKVTVTLPDFDVEESFPQFRVVPLKLLESYPNPTKDMVSIKFSVGIPGEVWVSVYNSAGSVVIGKRIEVKREGEFVESIDLSSLPSGVYFVRVERNDLKGGTLPVILLKN